MQIVTSTTASGTRTRSASVPGRCFGALTFGVGSRDEPVALRGITHLLLHLVEEAAAPALIPVQAFLDEDSVRFTASGTTAQVLARLRSLADAVVALGGVTKVELSGAKRLLRLEDSGEYLHPGVNALTIRYGLSELGRSGFGHPGADALTRKDALGWAATWFTAENAAVTLTKPLTASFDLDLPHGVVPQRGVPVPTMGTPVLVQYENANINVSLVVPARGADHLGEAIRLALRDRLREAGVAFSVDYDLARVDEARAAMTFSVDENDSKPAEGARILVNALRDIAEDGVSEGVLARGVEVEREVLAGDPESVLDSLESESADDLRGFTSTTRDEDLADALALTSEDVAARLTAALPTLIVCVYNEADVAKIASKLGLPLEWYHLLRDVPEKTWKKAVRSASTVWQSKKGEQDLEAVITETTLVVRYEASGTAAIDFADLVLVGERPDGTLFLVEKGGRWLSFAAAGMKSGKKFVAALRRAVPEELVVRFPAE